MDQRERYPQTDFTTEKTLKCSYMKVLSSCFTLQESRFNGTVTSFRAVLLTLEQLALSPEDSRFDTLCAVFALQSCTSVH